MSAITATAHKMTPLGNAIIRRYLAGGTGAVGDTVYMASDGDVEQASAGAAGTAQTIGVVISCATDGATAFAAGDEVDVVVWGHVGGFSGATPGAVAWQSDTAGKADTATGTTGKKIGRWESASVLFVQPVI